MTKKKRLGSPTPGELQANRNGGEALGPVGCPFGTVVGIEHPNGRANETEVTSTKCSVSESFVIISTTGWRRSISQYRSFSGSA